MAKPQLPVGIGSQQITFDATQFIQGMASSDYTPDGGIGASSYGINPKVVPGVIYATASEVDVSANLSGALIASCEDSQVSSGANRLFVDNAGNYYSYDGASMTKNKTGVATTHYTFGKTDMVSFNQTTYVSLDNDIAKWSTSANTLTESWWVTTKSKSALDSSLPHPLITFEGYMWVADGAQLYFIDTSETITAAPWTLNSSERIYALGIDPDTGMMLVSVQQTVNISDTLASKFYVYMYDGYSAKPRRKIPVDDLVTAFYSLGGTVYVGFGQSVGYWTGTGIAFLRKLVNVTLSFTELPYKHHFAHIGNTLYVADGLNVLAYGEIVRGNKVFYNIYKNQTNSNKLGCIASVGNNKLSVSYATNKFSTIDLSSKSPGNATLYSPNINFPRPVMIRRIRIFTTGITQTSGSGSLDFFDETLTAHSVAGGGAFVVPTGKTYYSITQDYAGVRCQTMQFRCNINTLSYGIIRIIIYYDTIE